MIIGLTGKKLTGKDTVGQYLVENYGFERRGFADKLKEAVAALFDMSVEEVDNWKEETPRGGFYPGHKFFVRWYERVNYVVPMYTQEHTLSWREFLQRFGTEMGREVFGEDFWVDLCLPWNGKPEQMDLRYMNKDIVITDVRFDSEAARILDLNGILIHIIRSSVEDGDEHVSEQGIDLSWCEYTIINDRDLEGLYKDIDGVMEDIRANS